MGALMLGLLGDHDNQMVAMLLMSSVTETKILGASLHDTMEAALLIVKRMELIARYIGQLENSGRIQPGTHEVRGILGKFVESLPIL